MNEKLIQKCNNILDIIKDTNTVKNNHLVATSCLRRHLKLKAVKEQLCSSRGCLELSG